ncbi:hypothetical protein EDB81DRAFT_23366 [Dactylonectria macrodidyma]|uniref:Uncharacterized protein n=1 Tax=Dactylonectria macrodidyma TaxID=307937 RepID=A0A9P9FR83_9HYPO|nr:hypothetical protein EDB81DRAFT_23366 [Dactylonectria macrodidyma]
MGRPRHDKAETTKAWEEWRGSVHPILARPTMENDPTSDSGTGSGVSHSMPRDDVRPDPMPGPITQTSGLPIGNMASGRNHSLDLQKVIPVEVQAKNGNWLSATARVCHRPRRRLAGTYTGVSEKVSKSLGYELQKFPGNKRPQHKLPNGDIVIARGTIPLPFKTADGGQVTEHVAVWTRTQRQEVPFQVLIDPMHVERLTVWTGLPAVGEGADDGGPSFQNPNPSPGSHQLNASQSGLQVADPSSDNRGVPQSFLVTFTVRMDGFAQDSGTANDSRAVLDNNAQYQELGNPPDTLRSFNNLSDDDYTQVQMGDLASIFPHPALGAATPRANSLYQESQVSNYQTQPMAYCQNLQLGGAVFGSFVASQTHSYEATQTHSYGATQAHHDRATETPNYQATETSDVLMYPLQRSYQPHEPQNEPEN